MAIDHCLSNAVDGGEISQEEADRLNREFERFRAQRAGASETTADAQAKKDLADLLRAETEHKRRKAKLAISSLKRIDGNLKSYRNAKGEADIAQAALDHIENFGSGGFSSVIGRKNSIVGMAHARMENLLHHFRRSAIAGDKGRWNKADLVNVVKEAFGVDTGDQAAKGFADAWSSTAEWLRERFNAAGGAIGKLENWGLPQHHDARALRNAGLEQWKAFIRDRLAPEKMRHPLTGQPVTAGQLDDVLSKVYYEVTTEGWIDRQPLRQPFGKGALANQHAEARFLVFKDPESWLQYQEAFGGGDPFSAMMGHVNMMARDIAAMEILGPNPNGTIEWMKQAITREAEFASAGLKNRMAGKAERALDNARKANQRLDAVWQSVRGALETPVDSRAANVMASMRTFITASVLGAAQLSSFTDVGTSAIARKFAGLGAKGTVHDIIRAMTPSTRREAVAAGLILDNAAHVFHTQARYVGTLAGNQWIEYFADRVLTFSGLTPWTQAARHAFGLAFQTEAAKLAGQALGDLPSLFRDTLKRWGFTEHEWNLIRKARLYDAGKGVKMLRPNEIDQQISPQLAERWLEMIQAETEYAVPSGSHRSRTALRGEGRPGTFWGELQLSATQFKSFGAVYAFLFGKRIHALMTSGERRQMAAGAAYAAGLLATGTLFGALGLQLKSIASGRDFRPMNSPDFWAAAMLQGGGIGIYGDFLFANINRYGGGFAETLAGPAVQHANDFWNLTAGNVVQLGGGEKTNFGRELVRFARGNVPGSNIWYLRLAFERTVFDTLQWWLDPEAHRSFRHKQQFFRKQWGQDYWWRPGQLAPDRPPAL